MTVEIKVIEIGPETLQPNAILLCEEMARLQVSDPKQYDDILRVHGAMLCVIASDRITQVMKSGNTMEKLVAASEAIMVRSMREFYHHRGDWAAAAACIKAHVHLKDCPAQIGEKDIGQAFGYLRR